MSEYFCNSMVFKNEKKKKEKNSSRATQNNLFFFAIINDYDLLFSRIACLNGLAQIEEKKSCLFVVWKLIFPLLTFFLLLGVVLMNETYSH